MSQLEQPAAQAADDQPDWMKQLDTPQQSAGADQQPDWLKGFESETVESAPSTGELDWLSQLGQESKPAETPSSELDFLKDLDSKPEAAPAASTDDFDFLNELTGESEQPSVPTAEPSMQESLGMSAEEQDDSFAWLESLAAKQGATEGLLTTPEERLEEEPEWVRQARAMSEDQPPAEGAAMLQPAGELEERGKREQDDSFVWLENLATQQGETAPEEKLEEEPEWVRQGRRMIDQPEETPLTQTPPQAVEEVPAAGPEPSASLKDLGKSEEERDDAFAWLESLAAKQGATEGLLTKPEERLEEEPEWVRQARDVSAEQLPAAEQPSAAEDTAAWLRSLDDEEALPASEPASPKDDTAMWFKNLEYRQKEAPAQPPRRQSLKNCRIGCRGSRKTGRLKRCSTSRQVL
jgi:hypothetical protein